MEFRIGKLRLNIVENSPGSLAIEYEIDAHRTQESLPSQEMIECVDDLRAGLRKFEDQRRRQEEAKAMFDSHTVSKLQSLGIRDFAYLTRGIKEDNE
ncbi:MAG: hypothetical protein ABH829_03470 [archaeon]